MHAIKFPIVCENVEFVSFAKANAYAPTDSPGPPDVVLLRG